MSKNQNNDDSLTGCIIFALLVVFLMPIVGGYLLISGDKEKRPLGWVLLIVGLVIWISLTNGS